MSAPLKEFRCTRGSYTNPNCPDIRTRLLGSYYVWAASEREAFSEMGHDFPHDADGLDVEATGKVREVTS